MAVYRNISLTFWEDLKIVDDFTPEDRYFYLYLLTNPHTNLLGCYQLSYRQMINETGYNRDTVEKLVNKMKKNHKVIEFDETTNEVLIKKWCKYNWTKSDKLLKSVEKLMKFVKSEKLLEILRKIYDEYRVCIGYGYPMDTSVSVSVSVSVSDIINNYINFINNNSIFNNNNLKDIFIKYLEMRIDKEYTVNEIVVKRLISKLEKVETDENRIEMVEQAITGGWKDFYKHESGEKKENLKKVNEGVFKI